MHPNTDQLDVHGLRLPHVEQRAANAHQHGVRTDEHAAGLQKEVLPVHGHRDLVEAGHGELGRLAHYGVSRHILARAGPRRDHRGRGVAAARRKRVHSLGELDHYAGRRPEAAAGELH